MGWCRNRCRNHLKPVVLDIPWNSQGLRTPKYSLPTSCPNLRRSHRYAGGLDKTNSMKKTDEEHEHQMRSVAKIWKGEKPTMFQPTKLWGCESLQFNKNFPSKAQIESLENVRWKYLQQDPVLADLGIKFLGFFGSSNFNSAATTGAESLLPQNLGWNRPWVSAHQRDHEKWGIQVIQDRWSNMAGKARDFFAANRWNCPSCVMKSGIASHVGVGYHPS